MIYDQLRKMINSENRVRVLGLEIDSKLNFDKHKIMQKKVPAS